MKTFLIIIGLVFLSHFSYGMITGPVKVEGTVVKYDKKKVVLDQNGQKITVPRSAIPEGLKIRTGKKVHALLKPADINKKQPSQKPVKSARNK